MLNYFLSAPQKYNTKNILFFGFMMGSIKCFVLTTFMAIGAKCQGRAHGLLNVYKKKYISSVIDMIGIHLVTNSHDHLTLLHSILLFLFLGASLLSRHRKESDNILQTLWCLHMLLVAIFMTIILCSPSLNYADAKCRILFLVITSNFMMRPFASYINKHHLNYYAFNDVI